MKTTSSRIDAHPSGTSSSESTATSQRETAGARTTGAPGGGLVLLDGEEYYRITDYDAMPPFMMTLASDSDLWMFVTSGGGLTAGRVDADRSLFPYETVDRLHDSHHHTGPFTLIRVIGDGGAAALWEPFASPGNGVSSDERNLYKSVTGTRLIFESINRDLGIAFRYRWAGSGEFGWVRTARIENVGEEPVAVEVLDGLRNVLAAEVHQSLCRDASNLVDAYRKSEIDAETGVGIYSLTSGIVDRPEAIEVLRANAVWCSGLDERGVHLDDGAVDAFRRGDVPEETRVVNGQRANYLVSASFSLETGGTARWHIVADAGLDHIQLAAVRMRILTGGHVPEAVDRALEEAERSLVQNVSSGDGIQLTADRVVAAHHFANVLFNNMRGGVPAWNYDLPASDLIDFIRTRNRDVAERQSELLGSLPNEVDLQELVALARDTGDVDLERLCHEYLPVYFGRRHGDPSRPWNRFSVRVRNGDGTRALRYEGNWRDIFQNWEALCASFPRLLPGITAKFANASTVDGFNPYRLARDGVDWEVPDPDDPWSHIGYWGDHQVIYFLKLLESMDAHAPGALQEMLAREIFSYAEVPYRIRPYEQIIEDPRATIVYDGELEARIGARVKAVGADGRLVTTADGSVYHASLLEKLLVPLLSKLSNLVPDGGIWMNTQRPEWNDANNALVGDGVSVVTLYYLRRYVAFLEGLLGSADTASAPVADEVVVWFDRIREILEATLPALAADGLSDHARRRLLDDLGGAFSRYRDTVYASGFSRKRDLSLSSVLGFCGVARRFLEHGIRANRRDDALYHSYLLLDIRTNPGEAALRPLQEMLEGQVAALSSGLLDGEEAVGLLERLFESPLYREDQRSFLLYPERTLPGFLEKNTVPIERVAAIPLLRDMLDAGDTSLIAVDAFGVCRFRADLRNARDLDAALDRLAARPEWAPRVARERASVHRLYESVFHHRSYTGRSGAMYSYEGLGCIYWHMVAKLLLAVQEIALRAANDGGSAGIGEALAALYYRIRSGLGFEKTPAEYGAFPTDPYSHTPRHGGAKQPGMTGQVKEEILTRFGELGVRVEGGVVRFRPVLLRPSEFLSRPAAFRFHDVHGQEHELELEPGSLAYTYCQVPVVYELTNGEVAWTRVIFSDGRTRTCRGDRLDEETSQAVFDRSGRVVRIHVGVPERALCTL